MASEFDNEIDFLLRQTARQTDFAPVSTGETTHLDADDLSAFAEDALPQDARLAFVSHLADCDLCRGILSNLILLNETAEEVTAAEPAKNIVTGKLSWLNSFKNLFAFPTLGYATIALAVLLVGTFAFVTLRQTQEGSSLSVAVVRQDEAEPQAKKSVVVHAPSAAKDEVNEPKPEEAPIEIPNSGADALVESTPQPVAPPADNLPPSVVATKRNNQNSASANLVARNEPSANNSLDTNSTEYNLAPEQKQQDSAIAGAASSADKAGEAPESQTAPAAPKPTLRAKEELRDLAKNKASEADDEKKDISGIARTAPEMPAAASSSSPSKIARKALLETRTVGGKTFQKFGAVWRDAAYNSQNVTNVSRDSAEYKKLDANLRSIAESLNGEIIVVWQDKAYRIR